MATPATIIKGDNLMLFKQDGSTYKSMAYATAHTLTISAETQNINSKDHGAWSGNNVNKLSWEITSENLYVGTEYDALFTAMTSRSPLTVAFGTKHEADNVIVADGDASCYTADASGYYYGNAYITSLAANANTGENATYSVTLTGTGKIAKKTT